MVYVIRLEWLKAAIEGLKGVVSLHPDKCLLLYTTRIDVLDLKSSKALTYVDSPYAFAWLHWDSLHVLLFITQVEGKCNKVYNIPLGLRKDYGIIPQYPIGTRTYGWNSFMPKLYEYLLDEIKDPLTSVKASVHSMEVQTGKEVWTVYMNYKGFDQDFPIVRESNLVPTDKKVMVMLREDSLLQGYVIRFNKLSNTFMENNPNKSGKDLVEALQTYLVGRRKLGWVSN